MVTLSQAPGQQIEDLPIPCGELGEQVRPARSPRCGLGGYTRKMSRLSGTGWIGGRGR